MGIARVNGVGLRFERAGSDGLPWVLVHGSFGTLEQWDGVASALSDAFPVVRYDRRGHGGSESPPGQGSVLDDVADLAALIDSLSLAPVWIAANSFGSNITLRLAAERPDLLAGIVVHEPPLISLLEDAAELGERLARMGETIGTVAARIEAGAHEEAAELFFTTLALAPGEWEQLPQAYREVAIAHAPTFLDETRDPEALAFDLEWLSGFERPVLLTLGEQSPEQYAAVLHELEAALPQAELRVLPGMGHLPHLTRPERYAALLASFALREERGRGR